MKEFMKLAFLLYLSNLQICKADSNKKCPSPTRMQGMKISVITHRNKTGHYIEQVTVKDLEEDGSNHRSWNVNMNTGKTICMGRNCSLLQTDFSPVYEVSPDYTYIPDQGYYKYHRNASTWLQAEETCESEGAHLVVISSREEQDAVVKFFHEHLENPIPYRNYLLFVGIYEWFSTRQFRTVLGQSLLCSNYVNWGRGQPDNISGTEHCTSIFNNGQLNDIDCNVRLPFICEIY